jgi:hypothetical protein
MRLRLNIIPKRSLLHTTCMNWQHPTAGCTLRKGMYGLPQAGILANQLLEK